MNLIPDFLRRGNQTQIDAVYNSDIEKLLQSLEIYDEVNTGKFECAVCEKEITIENIGKIYGENNEVKIICDNIKCLEK